MGEDMSGDGDEPAPAAVWARARERYEHGVEALASIAAEAGITRQALVVRARNEGWKLRGLPKPWVKRAQGTRATLARFKALLQQRLTVGAGGYIGGRSLEKVAGSVKARKPPGFPFIRGSDRKG